MSLYAAKTITILERDFGRRLIRAALGKPPRRTRNPSQVDNPNYGPGRYGSKGAEGDAMRARMPKDTASQGERMRLSQALDRGTMAGSNRRRPRGRPKTDAQVRKRQKALGYKPAPSTPSFGKRVEKKAPATPSFAR